MTPAAHVPDGHRRALRHRSWAGLMREAEAVYLAETKAQGQLGTPNLQRKPRAATARCERINSLAPDQRSQRPWRYVLLGEEVFHDWRRKGAHLAELLRYARVRPMDDVGRQQALSLGWQALQEGE